MDRHPCARGPGEIRANDHADRPPAKQCPPAEPTRCEPFTSKEPRLNCVVEWSSKGNDTWHKEQQIPQGSSLCRLRPCTCRGSAQAASGRGRTPSECSVWYWSALAPRQWCKDTTRGSDYTTITMVAEIRCRLIHQAQLHDGRSPTLRPRRIDLHLFRMEVKEPIITSFGSIPIEWSSFPG
jgi:hypothetical protein